jgi:D-alanine-D-alanine ligase
LKKLRVLLLTHPTLVPPDTLEGLDEVRVEELRTEYDVLSHLRAAGHEVRVLGVLDSLAELRAAITEWQPHVCFNLLEEFGGIVAYDHHVVAFLELMRQPYTGCNPRGMMLSRDKVLSKQLLAYHRIPTPHFAVFRRRRRLQVPHRLRYPLFVKSATDDASLGISQASVVEDEARLRERVQFIHEQTGSDALVEEFIEGRELYVGVVGNDRLTVFPTWELSFGSLGDSSATIATRKMKWDPRYKARHGISTGAAQDLPEGTAARLERLVRRIYRGLYLSGYARMDFRMRADGSLYVLEANANPMLASAEDFARSAASGGIAYPDLLQRILSLGLNYRSEWRKQEA